MRSTIVFTTIALFLAACSTAENGTHATGRIPLDPAVISPMSSPTPVAPAPAQVKVLDADGNPVVGIPILISDSEGRQIGASATSASGTASAQIPVNGGLSLVRSTGTSNILDTIDGINPGMSVGVGSPTSTNPIGTVSATLPPSRPDAAWYQVQAGCAETLVDQGGIAVSLTATTDCNPANVSVLVIARNASWQPVAWSAVAGAMPANGFLALGLPAWQEAFEDKTIVLANAPVGTLAVQASVGVLHNGLRYADSGSDALASAGSSATFVVKVPAGFADSFVVDASASFGGGSSSLIERRLVGASGSFAVDLGAELLPQLTITDVSAANGSVTWTMAGSVAVDAIRVGASWSDATGSTWQWSRVAPGTAATTAKIPSLPELFQRAKPVAAAMLDGATVSAIEADYVIDYAAVTASTVAFPAAPAGNSVLRISTSAR